jgi:hypothetical protein
MIYTIDDEWSVSQLLTESWHFIQHDESVRAIQVLQFVAFLAGMVLYHIRHRTFLFRRFSWLQAVKHFGAGMIMVAGVRMMEGGNDHLLFKKLPSLTPAALLLLVVMLASIAGTLFVGDKIHR